MSQEELLKELQEKGIKPSGREIDERDIEKMWRREITTIAINVDPPTEIIAKVEITETALCAEALQPALF